MDQLSEKKKKLEEQIVEIMITSLEKEKINDLEMASISEFVLEGIDKAQSEQEVKAFLRTLADKWEIFTPLVILEGAKDQEKLEDEVAQGVLILLEHGKIESAIKLAQSVTNKKEHNQVN